MKTISQRIDEWALLTPNAVCYQTEEKSYNYQQLKADSDAFAAYLMAEFPGNRQAIIVYGELEYQMIVAFLGASKAGHAYIPIESHTPPDRIELITSVAEFVAVVSIATWPLSTTTQPIIERSQFEQILTVGDSSPNSLPVTQAENYYIIFTSGTTGVPKGVQISHDNLVSFTNWILSDFSIEKQQRFLSQAPYSFDLSVMDIYPALLSGGCLLPLSKETTSEFKQLFRALPNMALNVWVSTPSFVDICLMDARFNEEELPTLRHFLFCGEELSHQTASQLLARFPEAKVFNTYGPTEATVAITQVEITPTILAKYDRLPIGRVKADTKVLICGEDGEVSKTNEPGEIVIVGPSVSKGYLNNPTKTAAAFFTYQGQQAYRTGDGGYFKDDLLFYQGRLDLQIKLHGYRMELGDIEHHLAEVSYVNTCVVVPKYHHHKVQQLVAFVVAEKNEFAKEYQLAKAIKAELAPLVMDYMLPQKFVFVDQLPLTANGKIDRRRLMDEVNGTC